MNDREMLEYAAKAAGYRFRTDKNWNGRISSQIYIEKAGPSDNLCWQEWNPMADDGDAFRLAVKLKFDVDIGEDPEATAVCSGCGPISVGLHVEAHNCDPYAATRRAIVRAAAEVGKAMEQNNG